jgi:Protein of unknown function (DUF4058)
MPLHDWRDDRGWSSLHLVWQAQLLDWVQYRLPPGYRAYLGSVPALTIDAPNGKPDLSVRQWQPNPPIDETIGSSANPEPDTESVAVFELDPQTAVHIDLHGQLVAAIEIVSPRNKDRTDARERYLRR